MGFPFERGPVLVAALSVAPDVGPWAAFRSTGLGHAEIRTNVKGKRIKKGPLYAGPFYRLGRPGDGGVSLSSPI